MQKNKSNSFILNRIRIYFVERFPLFLYFLFVAFLYLSLSYMTDLLSGNTPYISSNSLIGLFSAFFLMLLIRTFDDIKDEELDHEIFPNRPVSRGAILISDVKLISFLSFLFLVLINVLYSQKSLLVFSIMMIYLLLTFKWFFAKEIHIKKPKVAMITHQPIPFVIVFYLIHLALSSGSDYDQFTTSHFYLLLLFALPITAWEVSRKIKAKVNENKYETFSNIFGIKTAVSIPLILYTISGIIGMLIAHELHLSYYFYPVIICGLIMVYYYFIKFLVNPIPSNNVLKNVAMIFTSLLFVSLLVFLVIKYSINLVF